MEGHCELKLGFQGAVVGKMGKTAKTLVKATQTRCLLCRAGRTGELVVPERERQCELKLGFYSDISGETKKEVNLLVVFELCLFVCNRGDTYYSIRAPDKEAWPSPYHS